MKTFYPAVIIVTAIALLIGCGGGGGSGSSGDTSPPVSPASQVIGASGGTLSTADGALVIQVPAGALTSDVTLTAAPITASASRAVGQTWRIEPEGTTFATPVTITFKYTDAMLKGKPPENLKIAYQSAGASWTSLTPTLDKTAKTVSVTSSHFSDWSMVTVSEATTKLHISGALHHGRIYASVATFVVSDSFSFAVDYPWNVGQYGEPSGPGGTVDGPIGPEFELSDRATVVESASDSRSGCPVPSPQGIVEAFEIKSIKFLGGKILLLGKGSVPPVQVGVGENKCVGGTETIPAQTFGLTLSIGLTAAQWNTAKTQRVDIHDELTGWDFSIGP